MSNQERDTKVTDLLNQLLTETNKEPQGIGWHAVSSMPIPIEGGSDLLIGSMRPGNLDIFSQFRNMRRIARGTYRVAVFIIPEGGTAKVAAPLIILPR